VRLFGTPQDLPWHGEVHGLESPPATTGDSWARSWISMTFLVGRPCNLTLCKGGPVHSAREAKLEAAVRKYHVTCGKYTVYTRD